MSNEPRQWVAFGPLTVDNLMDELRLKAFAVTNQGLHQLIDARFPGLSAGGADRPSPVWYYERIIEMLDEIRDHYQELIQARDCQLENGGKSIYDRDFDELKFRFRKQYKQA
ncbi:MAG TPA: hypothetical protein VIY66_08070 [Candidatus Acidoferrales bacterium]